MTQRTRRGVLAALVVAFVTVAIAAPAAEHRVVELAVRGGKLAADRHVIRVQQGDDVTLSFTTDQSLTVHLHGYDIEKTLSPSAPTPMRFSARATGRFPIEVHGAAHGKSATLGYLEVLPR